MSEVGEVRAIVLEALGEGKAMDYTQLMFRLLERGVEVPPRGHLHALMVKMATEQLVERAGVSQWMLKVPPVLSWERPPKSADAAEIAEYYGGGIPGAYTPQMDREWMVRWKAKMAGQRSDDLKVEIRKTTAGDDGYAVAQVLLVVRERTVRMSMNATAEFSEREWSELSRAVEEARKAMRDWRAGQLARMMPDLSRETIEDMKGQA